MTWCLEKLRQFNLVYVILSFFNLLDCSQLWLLNLNWKGFFFAKSDVLLNAVLWYSTVSGYNWRMISIKKILTEKIQFKIAEFTNFKYIFIVKTINKCRLVNFWFSQIFTKLKKQTVQFKKYKWLETTALKFSYINDILLPKLFWPTVRKNCSSDREFLRSLEQFIQTVKGQNNFW